MEMVMTNGFAELNANEMIDVNGGSKEAAQAILIVGGAVLIGIGAPAAAIAAGAATIAGAGAFATAYVSGIGLMGTAFFL